MHRVSLVSLQIALHNDKYINICRLVLNWWELTDKEAEVIGERLKKCPNINLSKLE